MLFLNLVRPNIDGHGNKYFLFMLFDRGISSCYATVFSLYWESVTRYCNGLVVSSTDTSSPIFPGLTRYLRAILCGPFSSLFVCSFLIVLQPFSVCLTSYMRAGCVCAMCMLSGTAHASAGCEFCVWIFLFVELDVKTQWPRAVPQVLQNFVQY
jgi:hypothetical protein